MSARRTLPAPPQTQALSSTTFRPPPLDGSLSLPEVFDWHLQHTPNHRLFIFAKDDGDIRTIYWPEAVKAIHVGATIIQDRIKGRHELNDTPVVAILAPSDAIPYFTIMMSIMRANYIAFPISPRNSPVAVAHLINKAKVRHILVGREPAILDLARDALHIVQAQYQSTALPELSPMPLFEELFLPPSEQAVTAEDVPYEFKGSDAVVMILHSSGSTAFPKPIMWTNHRFAQLSLIPWFGERDLTDQVFSLHTMPMYHGMGVLQLCWTASCGLVVSSFEPKSPAPVPTPDALFKAAKATESDIIFCVPSFIEAWARNPGYVRWLAARGGVLFGGGPLNKEAGDLLTSQGVSIFILYGSTEGGIMSPILPAKVGYDWDYFKFPKLVTAEMVQYGENTFEFVMVSNEVCTPSVLNTQVHGVDSYATSDLMVPHPSKPGYWKVFGRTDDQIMHNTGEKTNPGPLENMLNQDPHVLASVMFGRGRFQAGVLVDPKPEYRLDFSDDVKLAEFRNKIWPTVERMNTYAPQHSRLFKEMVLVAKPSKPFTYTAKNTARRQAVINDYQSEIDALYDRVEESTQSSIPPPILWDIVSTTDFIRAVVNKVLVHKVGDDDDVFQYGCDSLQATWIRNSLLRALRDSAQLDTRKTVGNFVYDYPTIKSLASFVTALASGTDATSDKAVADAMRVMATKYSANFPVHRSGDSAVQAVGDTVLVTGTTGSLGCHILARLASDSAISRIYALNRASIHKEALAERQNAALHSRGIDASITDSGKVVLLEGDLTVADFGLPEQTYKEMHQSVTHIIHNAWRVDFNLALTSFESNVKGLRSLVDFALTSPLPQPPHIVYTSSIGVFQNVQGDDILSETTVEAEIAVGTGYSESKWVSENILHEAASKTSLSTTIVRVGQICGGASGAWNTSEWFPSVVQSAEKLRCFPDDHRNVSWVSPEVAAAALVEFRKATSQKSIVHLVHPHPVPWSSLAAVIASQFSIALVPYNDWLIKLERTTKFGADNDRVGEVLDDLELLRSMRALRLLSFFRSLTDSSGGQALGFPELSTTQAVSFSPTLANASTLTSEDVHRWLEYWRQVGLFTSE